MISAWKKLISKNSTDNATIQSSANGMPPGIHKLDKELQKKFSRGVNYNMKVVIKGDNRVGKTSLFLRLKGYGFDDNYNPTESLNVTSIDWNYKATDDVVKIDLWEAVDTASKRNVNFVDLKTVDRSDLRTSMDNSNTNGRQPMANGDLVKQHSSSNEIITSTKLHPNSNSNLEQIPETARQSLAELSEVLDVYKGANAVLLVMDITKLWTFKYIQSEMLKIPKHLPVLIVANHRDQGHHRTVSPEQVTAYIHGLNRNQCDGIVMYTEASMKNGFGIRLIEKFFSIPFLKLQESSLLKQLEINRQDFLSTREELQLLQDSINKEYEQYLELQTIKRRQQADAMSPVNSGLRQLDESRREQIRNTTMSSDDIDKRTNAKSIEYVNKSNGISECSKNLVNDRLPSIIIGAKCPLPENKPIQLSASSVADPAQSFPDGSTQVDDNRKGSDDSDDEDELRANPLVADYQSDIDSDDQVKS